MNIKIPKFKEFEDSLNEMAFKNPKTGKSYQKGDFVKVIIKDNPRTNETNYMRIINNARKYIYGEILFTDSEILWPTIEVHGDNVYPPDEEWNYIQPKIDEIKELKNQKWFILGDEEVFMDIKGNKINLKQGNYKYDGYSLNFELTKKFKEPVIKIHMMQTKLQDKNEFFYIKLSDIKSLFPELTASHYEAIADWFNENTDIEVTWEGKNNHFNIKELWILVDEESNPDFLHKSEKGKTIVAGPFINMKQAKQMLEYFKKIEGTTLYDKNKLIIDKLYGYYSNNPHYISVELNKLIAFAKVNGIKANLRDILNSKSAVIAFKNFGF